VEDKLVQNWRCRLLR